MNPLHQALPQVAANLVAIKVSTLIVWGSGDRFVPLEAVKSV